MRQAPVDVKVSAVIPNYNHAHLLPRAVGALMAQSRQPDEIIVVDDGSTDGSVEALRSMEHSNHRLLHVRHERNLGTAAATNTGVRAARGEFVYMGAADDVALPGLIKKTCSRLTMFGGAGLCGSICLFTDHKSGLSYKFGAAVPTLMSPLEVEKVVLKGDFLVSCAGALWRRQAVLDAGLFDESLRWHTDWLLLFKVAFTHGLCFIPEVLSEVHLHRDGYSSAGQRRKSEQLAVLRATVDAVRRSGVEERVRRSGAMACFGKEMLWVLISNPRNWRYMTPSFLRLCALWTARRECKKLLPGQAARWYIARKGLRA